MSKYFVIGDIHGRADMLATVLRDWDEKNEQLVFLGDYIDYGPSSYTVVREVQELVKRYGAIALSGNHDEYFANLINGDVNNNSWHDYGRDVTFRSFLGKDYSEKDFEGNRELIRSRHQQYIDFLKDLPKTYENDSFIFAHSGIDLINDTGERRIDKHSRGQFIRSSNRTGKLIVFGHSRTGIIRGMNEGHTKSELYSMPFLDDRVWVSPCGTKLGIDGGAVFSGLLHGAHLDTDADEISVVSVNQNNEKQHTKFSFDNEFNRIKL